MSMDLYGVPVGVEPEHRGRSTRRPDEVEHRPDRGRLPRAVRSEEPEDLAGRDGEGDVVDPSATPVPLREPVQCDRLVPRHPTTSPWRWCGLGVGRSATPVGDQGLHDCILSGPAETGLTVLSPQGRSTHREEPLAVLCLHGRRSSLPPRSRDEAPPPRASRSPFPLARGRQPLLPHEGAVEGEQRPGAGKSGSLRGDLRCERRPRLERRLIMGFAGADQSAGVILLAGISGCWSAPSRWVPGSTSR